VQELKCFGKVAWIYTPFCLVLFFVFSVKLAFQILEVLIEDELTIVSYNLLICILAVIIQPLFFCRFKRHVLMVYGVLRYLSSLDCPSVGAM